MKRVHDEVIDLTQSRQGPRCRQVSPETYSNNNLPEVQFVFDFTNSPSTDLGEQSRALNVVYDRIVPVVDLTNTLPDVVTVKEDISNDLSNRRITLPEVTFNGPVDELVDIKTVTKPNRLSSLPISTPAIIVNYMQEPERAAFLDKLLSAETVRTSFENTYKCTLTPTTSLQQLRIGITFHSSRTSRLSFSSSNPQQQLAVIEEQLGLSNIVLCESADDVLLGILNLDQHISYTRDLAAPNRLIVTGLRFCLDQLQRKVHQLQTLDIEDPLPNALELLEGHKQQLGLNCVHIALATVDKPIEDAPCRYIWRYKDPSGREEDLSQAASAKCEQVLREATQSALTFSVRIPVPTSPPSVLHWDINPAMRVHVDTEDRQVMVRNGKLNWSILNPRLYMESFPPEYMHILEDFYQEYCQDIYRFSRKMQIDGVHYDILFPYFHSTLRRVALPKPTISKEVVRLHGNALDVLQMMAFYKSCTHRHNIGFIGVDLAQIRLIFPQVQFTQHDTDKDRYELTSGDEDMLRRCVEWIQTTATVIPAYWSPTSNGKTDVAVHSPLGKAVRQLLRCHVASIVCIQNPQLLRRYQMTATRSLEGTGFVVSTDYAELCRMLSISERRINEKLLFHGTSYSKAQAIIQQGFDARLSNASGFFGAGAYFAEDLEKARQYCKGPGCYIILARVVLGDVCVLQRHQRLRRPPCKQSCPTDTCAHTLYDSVCGSVVERHREFIVYENDRVYPELLVQLS